MFIESHMLVTKAHGVYEMIGPCQVCAQYSVGEAFVIHMGHFNHSGQSLFAIVC